MTDPNDKLLDEYLRRESIVSQCYREIESAEVPPALDAAVLARARASSSMGRRASPIWMKWAAPLALAASAVLVVAIVLEVGVQEEVQLPAALTEHQKFSEPRPETRVVEDPEARAVEEVMQDAPVAAAPPAPPAPRLEVPAPVPAAAAPSGDRERALRAASPPATEREAIESVVANERRRQASFQDAPLPATAMSRSEVLRAPTEATAAADAVAARSADLQERGSEVSVEEIAVAARTRQAQRRNGPRATGARSSPAAESSAPHAPRLAPEAWLERIRELRREGKLLEADEQWKEFIEAYPDFAVPEADSARPTR